MRSPEPALLRAMLAEHAAGLADIALHAARVPAGADSAGALDVIERAVATIRAALAAH